MTLRFLAYNAKRLLLICRLKLRTDQFSRIAWNVLGLTFWLTFEVSVKDSANLNVTNGSLAFLLCYFHIKKRVEVILWFHDRWIIGSVKLYSGNCATGSCGIWLCYVKLTYYTLFPSVAVYSKMEWTESFFKFSISKYISVGESNFRNGVAEFEYVMYNLRVAPKCP